MNRKLFCNVSGLVLVGIGSAVIWFAPDVTFKVVGTVVAGLGATLLGQRWL
jgi:hypothetical protein